MEKSAGHKGTGSKALGTCNIILRLLVIAATLTAAIVMGLAKETKTITIVVAPTLPSLPVPVPAKFSDSSAFVYFVVANAIACFYTVLSLVISIIHKASALPISIADIAVVALLFSGNGAAAAIGVVGERGNSHVRWNKVCNVFTKFCAYVMASITVSLAGCLAHVLILLLAFVGLHKKSPNVNIDL